MKKDMMFLLKAENIGKKEKEIIWAWKFSFLKMDPFSEIHINHFCKENKIRIREIPNYFSEYVGNATGSQEEGITLKEHLIWQLG